MGQSQRGAVTYTASTANPDSSRRWASWRISESPSVQDRSTLRRRVLGRPSMPLMSYQQASLLQIHESGQGGNARPMAGAFPRPVDRFLLRGDGWDKAYQPQTQPQARASRARTSSAPLRSPGGSRRHPIQYCSETARTAPIGFSINLCIYTAAAVGSPATSPSAHLRPGVHRLSLPSPTRCASVSPLLFRTCLSCTRRFSFSPSVE